MTPQIINIDEERKLWTKSDQIKKSLSETKEKRLDQTCHVRSIKVESNKLNNVQGKHLDMLFVEAKWLKNHILSLKDWKEMSEFDTKTKIVLVLNKDKEYETRELLHLSSQMKQEIQKQILNDIRALGESKKKSRKAGRLKFVAEVNCINLKQFGNTFSFVGTNKIKLQGLKRPIHVRGLKQIAEGDDIANAKLIKKPSGIYFKITTYKQKLPVLSMKNKPNVGIDFGVGNDMTLDNGVVLTVKQNSSKRLIKAHRNLSKKTKKSKNRWKAKEKLQLAYEKENNIKFEIKIKIGSFFRNETNFLGIQDENIKGWHSGLFGRQIQQSAIGGIIEELKKNSRTLIVDRKEPTTKKCRICGHINKHMTLFERTFWCAECGHTENRDVHSAKNMLKFADENLENKKICTERTSKPVELSASVIADQLIDNCKWISMKQETSELKPHSFSMR